MTVDKVRPLLAFAFVACLCAGILAAGMNRTPAHRVVTETRIPATALPRESTLVLGSTLEGRPVSPKATTPTPPLSRLSSTGVVTPLVTTPAVSVSAPRSRPVTRHATHQVTGAHRSGTSSPGKTATSSKHAKPGKPVTKPSPTTTQPVVGHASAPGQVKKQKRTAQLTRFRAALLPGVPVATQHGKGHGQTHAKAHGKTHAKAHGKAHAQHGTAKAHSQKK